jgi:hypothetical protein
MQVQQRDMVYTSLSETPFVIRVPDLPWDVLGSYDQGMGNSRTEEMEEKD